MRIYSLAASLCSAKQSDNAVPLYYCKTETLIVGVWLVAGFAVVPVFCPEFGMTCPSIWVEFRYYRGSAKYLN